MLFGELRHVEPEQGLLRAEEGGGQGLAQLGLAHAGGAEKEEGAHRAVRLLEPCPAPADGPGHGGHRLLLAGDPAAQVVLQVQRRCLSDLVRQVRGIPVHWGDRLGHVLGGDHGIFLPGLPAEAFQFQLPAEVGLGVSVLGGFLVVLAGNGVVPFPGGGL